MKKERAEGKTAIKVKNIVNHVCSLYHIMNNHCFVFTPTGQGFYIQQGHRIPAKRFETIHIEPLQKNQHSQDNSPDKRAIN